MWKLCRLRQLQQAVRAAGRQAVTGRVVEHAHAHVQLGLVHLAVLRHHLQVGPVGAARHRQDAHAQRGQPRELHGPAGLLHHHRIARAQQRAAHDVQRVCGAHGGDDVLGIGVHVERGQLLRQHPAQAAVAHRLAVLKREVLQGARAGDLAHGGRHEGRLQPVGRKHAHARVRLVADLVEHAADQRRRVDGRRPAAGPRGSGLGFARQTVGARRGHFAHEEAPVLARLHQALREQLVVGGHHGGGAHAVLQRALAHRGQARTGRQQAAADAVGEAHGELLGQGLCGVFISMSGHPSSACTVASTNTDSQLRRSTVLVVYWRKSVH